MLKKGTGTFGKGFIQPPTDPKDLAQFESTKPYKPPEIPPEFQFPEPEHQEELAPSRVKGNVFSLKNFIALAFLLAMTYIMAKLFL